MIGGFVANNKANKKHGPSVSRRLSSNGSDDEASSDSDETDKLDMPKDDDQITLRLLLKEIRILKRDMKKQKRMVKQMTSNDGVSLSKLMETFKIFDQDNSGTIDEIEFDQVLQHIGANINSSDYDLLWGQLAVPDADGNQELDSNEFVALCQVQKDSCPGCDMTQLLQLVIEAEMEKARKMLRCSTELGAPKVNLHGKYPHAPYKFKPSRKDCFARTRMEIHFVMEDEEYSTLSAIMFHIIMLFILTSTIAYIMETVPYWDCSHVPKPAHVHGPNFRCVWNILEAVVSIFFSAELFLRLFACRNPAAFWKRTFYFYDVMNLIDLLAVLPFWIELSSGAESGVLRIIRVVRLTRLLRLRRFKAMAATSEVLQSAFQKTMSSSCAIVSMLIIFECVFFSAFIYVVERGTRFGSTEGSPGCPTESYMDENVPDWSWDDYKEWCDLKVIDTGVLYERFDMNEITNAPGGKYYWFDLCEWNDLYKTCDGRYLRKDQLPSPFDSIPASIWWTMTTISTVGYGDVTPLTGWGRFIACMCMLTGVVVVAIFVVIIAGNFDEALTEMQRKLDIDKQKDQLKMERLVKDKEQDKERKSIVELGGLFGSEEGPKSKDRGSLVTMSNGGVAIEIIDEKKLDFLQPRSSVSTSAKAANAAGANLQSRNTIFATEVVTTSAHPGPGSDYDEPVQRQFTSSMSDVQRQATYTMTENFTLTADESNSPSIYELSKRNEVEIEKSCPSSLRKRIHNGADMTEI